MIDQDKPKQRNLYIESKKTEEEGTGFAFIVCAFVIDSKITVNKVIKISLVNENGANYLGSNKLKSAVLPE